MNNAYVYVLIDPIKNYIFYVGKGTGRRDLSHLKPSVWKNPQHTTNPYLYGKIKKLIENNTPPYVVRIIENITEYDAYQYEGKLIEKMGRQYVDGGILLNISDFKGGSYRGQSKKWSEERKNNYRQKCKTNRIYNPTYNELYKEYVIDNFSRKFIAYRHNISEALVKRRLTELKIKKPREKCYPSKNEFKCINCNKIFFTPRCINNRKFCSAKCYRGYNEI